MYRCIESPIQPQNRRVQDRAFFDVQGARRFLQQLNHLAVVKNFSLISPSGNQMCFLEFIYLAAMSLAMRDGAMALSATFLQDKEYEL